jgi:hypothetical protein
MGERPVMPIMCYAETDRAVLEAPPGPNQREHRRFSVANDVHISDAGEWRPVVGWEGFYEVSNLGEVRPTSQPRPYTTKTGRKMTRRPRATTCSAFKLGGYLGVKLSDKSTGRRENRTIHSLVCEAFHGPAFDGAEVSHEDGNSLNNCAANLAWRTRQANALLKADHGTLLNRDNGHARAKLTSADVQTARQLRASGMSLRAVGRHFGVSGTAIWLATNSR